MRKLTAFVIALLLGIAGVVVFDGRTDRAAKADPRAIYRSAIYASHNGRRDAYFRAKNLLKAIADYKIGGDSEAAAARRLLNVLPAFDWANLPDYTHDGGGGDGK
jgi:hypothetical protein